VVEEGRGEPVIRRVALVLALLASGLGAGFAAAQEKVDKVPIVAVIGCLVERGANTWMLTNATDPEPSIANGPPANQIPKEPVSGKNQFTLIGISEFDLPSHKGHTLLVKALFIKAAPVSRLNVTSVTMVAPTCAAPAK
jgi:hypothetical protein